MYNLTKVGDYLKCLLLLDMQLKYSRVQMLVATQYATHQEIEFKCYEAPFTGMELLYLLGEIEWM